MDRSKDALDPLLDLLYTGSTNQAYICDTLRAIGESGEISLCDVAMNASRSRERHVAAAALGRMPHGYNVNGK